jgi:ketosteroid isomerase-like protein
MRRARPVRKSREEPTDTALAFVDRINARDHEGLSRLMTAGFVFIDYGGAHHSGRDRMRDGFRRYFEACPKYRIVVEQVFRSGNDSVVTLGRAEGSHLGPEREKRERLVWKADVRNGLVSEWRIYASPGVVTEA